MPFQRLLNVLYLCRLPAHKTTRTVILVCRLSRGRGGRRVFGGRKQTLMLSDHHCHQLLDLRSGCEEKQTQMFEDYYQNDDSPSSDL